MKKTIIFVAAMFLISAPTQAELLEYDWKSFGDGDITLDTKTGKP